MSAGSRPPADELTAAPPTSPFKGLGAFDASAEDAMLFFGRDREREIITANLLASRVTVLYGASGVGKSSVLRAGVAYPLRELAQRSVAVGDRPELAVVLFGSWSGDPVQQLRRAVAAELVGGTEADGSRPEPLADALQRWTNELGVDLYLILDQFEEYFLYHQLAQGEGTLAHELPEVLTRPHLRVNTLLSLREDALATLDFFKARVPNLLGNRLRLEQLDRPAGRAAIVGPIQAYNELAPVGERIEIEPELVEAVLDQVETSLQNDGEPMRSTGRIEAPYLQLVMERLWAASQISGERKLRRGDLGQLGGAHRIVEHHLQNALETLTPAEQDAAADMFDHLVTPSGTKIAHRVSDLRRYAESEGGAADQVLDRLAADRILRPLAEAPEGEGRRYEIFHDVLAGAIVEWREQHEAQRALKQARRDSERRARRALLVAGAALVVLAAMTVVAVFALTQRSHARNEARRARARALAATALSQLSDDPRGSVRLALEAASLERTPQIEDALRQALLAEHERLVLPAKGPVTTASFNPRATRILTGSSDGHARLYEARTGRLLYDLSAGGAVTTASFDPDGALFVTGSKRGSTRVWDTFTGDRVNAWPSRGAIGGASFSADGKLVAAASADRTVRVWRVDDSRLLLRVRQAEPVLDVVFSPDGTRLLTMTDRAAWLFSFRTGRLMHKLSHGGGLTSTSFSPDGTLVVTTSKGKKALLWNARTGRVLYALGPHKGRVTTASFSPDGTKIVTASADEAARVWEVSNGKKEAVLPVHTNQIRDASFSPDGRFVVTASMDRTATVWDAENGRPINRLIGHGDSVVEASYSSTGDRVVTASDDRTARVWDPGTEDQLRAIGRHRSGTLVVAASFSHDGTRAVSAGEDGTARIWRVSGREQVAVVKHGGPVTSASFSPDDSRLLTTSEDGTARISQGSAAVVLHHRGPVLDGSFSPDGRLVVTAGEDGSARIWRADSGKQRAVLRHGRAVRTAEFSPDGKAVVTASDDRTARIWNARNGSLIHVLRGHGGGVVSASFSRNGRLIVTLGAEKRVAIWDASSGARVRFLGHKVTSASFSPDSRLLVTSSRGNGDEQLWSVATGKKLHVLRGHLPGVSDAQFSPDGRWIVTAGPGASGLWRTNSERPLLYLFGHQGPLTSASFSQDGRRIITSGVDGTVRTYSCEICAGIDGLVHVAKQRLARAGRNLSPQQRLRYGIG